MEAQLTRGPLDEDVRAVFGLMQLSVFNLYRDLLPLPTWDLARLIDFFLHDTICVAVLMLMGILQPGEGEPQALPEGRRVSNKVMSSHLYALAVELPLVITHMAWLVFTNWKLGA